MNKKYQYWAQICSPSMFDTQDLRDAEASELASCSCRKNTVPERKSRPD